MSNTDFVGYDKYINDDSNVIVVIDAGHGGVIDGKYETAPNKMYDHGDFVFYEGLFNRMIATKFAAKLKKSKISHVFTTTSNYDVSLPVRVSKANNTYKINKDKLVYLVSIHGNAAGVNSASGIEGFTSPGLTKSDYICDAYLNELNEVGWKMRYGRDEYLERDKESRFYILVNTLCPAILLELGFFTNKKQAEDMMKAEMQDKIVDLMLSAHKKVVDNLDGKE